MPYLPTEKVMAIPEKFRDLVSFGEQCLAELHSGDLDLNLDAFDIIRDVVAAGRYGDSGFVAFTAVTGIDKTKSSAGDDYFFPEDQ
jgi:hypothetical protein